jgi:hypothetical protein
MAGKKRARKKTRGKVLKKKVYSSSKSMNVKKKTGIVINNLLLFIALSLVSFVLYRFVQNTFFTDLFFVMAMVFGFVAVGFLIAFLILIILKSVSKKRH